MTVEDASLRGTRLSETGTKASLPFTKQMTNTKGKKEANMPKLSRKFGKFHCSLCSKQWHSAYTWCNEEGEPVFTQQCKSCKTEEFPYKIFDLICPKCGIVAKDCKCLKEKSVYNKNKHLQSAAKFWECVPNAGNIGFVNDIERQSMKI